MSVKIDYRQLAIALIGALVTGIAGTNSIVGAAGIREVRVDSSYVATGDKVTGSVVLDPEQAAKSAMLLVVTAVRETDVQRVGHQGSSGQEIVLQQKTVVADAKGIPFVATTPEMLTGSIRFKAELFEAGQAKPISTSWGPRVEVGVRKRISLHGPWDVGKVEPLAFEDTRRPKTWKVPDFGSQITFPGPITRDPWFRGWVTLKRQFNWPKDGDLRPRMLRISGVSNSAKVSVAGKTIGEVLPVEEIEVLSHWVEYHSKYKGDANKLLRMQMLDVDVQPPMSMPLPALPASGESTIELTLRGTHAMFQPKPIYGLYGDLHLEMAPAVFIESVSFDTEKPGPNRLFKFKLSINNTTGAPWTGRIRSGYGNYLGEVPYTGACPAYAGAEQSVTLPKGVSQVEVLREEPPRFATCRAMFLLAETTGKVLDAEHQDFHTVTMEIRDRRDFYLNNERFLIKAQGSWGEDANSRLQLRLMGANAFRAQRSVPSREFPGQYSTADNIDDRYKDGLLTSGGGFLASVEKCTFFDPKDTSNITRAVKGLVRTVGQCPGLIVWEATNELHGEPEEARVAIVEAYHKLDPYHRPVLATKGSGEWEAEAREGRVAGVDIVGVQYLLTREGVDSVTAAITEQPIMSTEVNWFDLALHTQDMWRIWLDKGVAGSLLFDYSGNSMRQPVPMVPPPDSESYAVVRQANRKLYQDLLATADLQSDGRVLVTVGNQMPYTLRQAVVFVHQLGRFEFGDLEPGDAVTLLVPRDEKADPKEPVVVRAEYSTHGGLAHQVILTPSVSTPEKPKPAKATKGGGK